MIMYVLGDGVAHAEPVRARRPDQGRPSRFTGVTSIPVEGIFAPYSFLNIIEAK
jgi:hypothetical protein